MLGVRTAGLGIRERELEVLDVRGAVVTDRAGDLVLLMHRMIDQHAFGGSRDALLGVVTLGALRRRHGERHFALGVERELEVVGDRQVQLAERLCLVKQEHDRRRADRHMARHAADLRVGGAFVRRDRVVLDLVAALRAEPARRGHSQCHYHDGGESQDRYHRPHDETRAPHRVFES